MELQAEKQNNIQKKNHTSLLNIICNFPVDKKINCALSIIDTGMNVELAIQVQIPGKSVNVLGKGMNPSFFLTSYGLNSKVE